MLRATAVGCTADLAPESAHWIAGAIIRQSSPSYSGGLQSAPIAIVVHKYNRGIKFLRE